MPRRLQRVRVNSPDVAEEDWGYASDEIVGMLLSMREMADGYARHLYSLLATIGASPQPSGRALEELTVWVLQVGGARFSDIPLQRQVGALDDATRDLQSTEPRVAALIAGQSSSWKKIVAQTLGSALQDVFGDYVASIRHQVEEGARLAYPPEEIEESLEALVAERLERPRSL